MGNRHEPMLQLDDRCEEARGKRKFTSHGGSRNPRLQSGMLFASLKHRREAKSMDRTPCRSVLPRQSINRAEKNERFVALATATSSSSAFS